MQRAVKVCPTMSVKKILDKYDKREGPIGGIKRHNSGRDCGVGADWAWHCILRVCMARLCGDMHMLLVSYRPPYASSEPPVPSNYHA